MDWLIFSDIDGTLYPGTTVSHHSPFVIHPQTLVDIAFAKSLGVKFILCTGNPYFEHMRKLAKRLDTDLMISSNGAGIVDVATDQYLVKSLLPQKIVQDLVDFASAIGLSADWWDEQILYFNSVSHPRLVQWWSDQEGFIVQISDRVLSDCFKVEFHHESDASLLDTIELKLKKLQVQYARMSPVRIEVTAPNVSKGSAITWVAAHYKVALKDTMGIGDSANDLPMFNVVGHAYAMANAMPNVKAAAHHHTASVEQNGLGMAIVDFLHRKGYRAH